MTWEEAWEQYKDVAAEQVHLARMTTKLEHGFADHPIEKKFVYCQNFPDMIDYFICAKCDKPVDKHHTDMIPFDQLSDTIKAYDYATAKVVFKVAYEAGYDDGAEDVRQDWWASV